MWRNNGKNEKNKSVGNFGAPSHFTDSALRYSEKIYSLEKANEYLRS